MDSASILLALKSELGLKASLLLAKFQREWPDSDATPFPSVNASILGLGSRVNSPPSKLFREADGALVFLLLPFCRSSS